MKYAAALFLLLLSPARAFSEDSWEDKLKIAVSTAPSALRVQLLKDVFEHAGGSRALAGSALSLNHKSVDYDDTWESCCTAGWEKGASIRTVAALHLAWEHHKRGEKEEAIKFYQRTLRSGNDARFPGLSPKYKRKTYGLSAYVSLMSLFEDKGQVQFAANIANLLKNSYADQPVLAVAFKEPAGGIMAFGSLHAVAAQMKGMIQARQGNTAGAIKNFETLMLRHGHKFDTYLGDDVPFYYGDSALNAIFNLRKRKDAGNKVKKSLLFLASNLKQKPALRARCYQFLAQFFEEQGDAKKAEEFKAKAEELLPSQPQ